MHSRKVGKGELGLGWRALKLGSPPWERDTGKGCEEFGGGEGEAVLTSARTVLQVGGTADAKTLRLACSATFMEQKATRVAGEGKGESGGKHGVGSSSLL